MPPALPSATVSAVHVDTRLGSERDDFDIVADDARTDGVRVRQRDEPVATDALPLGELRPGWGRAPQQRAGADEERQCVYVPNRTRAHCSLVGVTLMLGVLLKVKSYWRPPKVW